MSKGTTEQPEQNVLIVDDNPTNLQLLAEMLKKRGYKVRSAINGQLALQAARNNPPDIILLDINMPGMNGYEVCEQLKADESLAAIPVIFVSALDETIDKIRAFGAGGVDYITKPFQIPEVEARVQTHLELCRQKRELERSYAQLREAEGLRDNLVHMLAHDLRNSLTAISGYLELIELTGRKTLTEKTLGYVKKGNDSVATLVGMLNTMLDVSRMEAGALRLNLSGFNIVATARKVLSENESFRDQRQLILDEPDDSVDVIADRDLVRRVIHNLIGNALKVVPKDGWIRLGIEDLGGSIRVAVSDNGPGIPGEYHEKIFEKFGQAESGPGGKSYSTGLGLTFCKLAVEAHEGRIGLESEPGSGSTFWFEIPSRGPSSFQV